MTEASFAKWALSALVAGAIAFIPAAAGAQTVTQTTTTTTRPGTPATDQAGVLSAVQKLQVRQLGYNTGYQAGKSDFSSGKPYDFLSQPAYSQGNQGYNPSSGVDLETYRINYRAGFEDGYDDGYHGRTPNGDAARTRTYTSATPVAAPAGAATGTQTPEANATGSATANNSAGNISGNNSRSNAAGTPAGQANAATVSGTVPQGTALKLKLDNTVSSRSSNPGDQFTATITEPVADTNGQIVIPAGSIVRGTIGAVTNGGLTGSSQLNLNFNEVQLPNGQTAYLHANLTGVQAQQNGVTGAIAGAVEGQSSTNPEGQVTKSNTRTTVGEVAAGTGLGAIIGAVAGGGKGAAVGGLLGAGLGALLSSRTHSIDLPAGSPMTITLSQPLYIH